MAAGTVFVETIEGLDAATVSGAIIRAVAATDATARFAFCPVNVGKGMVIVAISQA